MSKRITAQARYSDRSASSGQRSHRTFEPRPFGPPKVRIDAASGPTGTPDLFETYQKRRQAVLASDRPVVQRAVFGHGGNAYETEDVDLASKDIAEGSTATSVSKSVDQNLPTAYGVLDGLFGSDLQTGLLKTTAVTALDRPRSVSASIVGGPVGGREDPITSLIGNLGDDELWIREGVLKSTYDGGHLVGAEILGKEAKEAYNIAPQESVANEQYYNNTVESVLRGANTHQPGIRYDYTVQLGYERNNYVIDQAALVQNGLLKAQIKNKPWQVVLPSRVPNKWSATAQITGPGAWAKPGGDTLSKGQKSVSKLEEQEFSLPGSKEEPLAAFLYQHDTTTKTVSFSMTQYVPTSKAPSQRPDTDYEEISLANPSQYEDALKPISDIRKDLPIFLSSLETEVTDFNTDFDTLPDVGILKRSLTLLDFPVPESRFDSKVATPMEDCLDEFSASLVNWKSEANRTRVAQRLTGLKKDLPKTYRNHYRRRKDAFQVERDTLGEFCTQGSQYLGSIREETEEISEEVEVLKKRDFNAMADSDVRELDNSLRTKRKRLKLHRNKPIKDELEELVGRRKKRTKLAEEEEAEKYQKTIDKAFLQEVRQDIGVGFGNYPRYMNEYLEDPQEKIKKMEF